MTDIMISYNDFKSSISDNAKLWASIIGIIIAAVLGCAMIDNIGICFLIYKSYRLLSNRIGRHAKAMSLLKDWICMGSVVLLFGLIEKFILINTINIMTLADGSSAILLPMSADVVGCMFTIIKLIATVWLLYSRENMSLAYGCISPIISYIIPIINRLVRELFELFDHV